MADAGMAENKETEKNLKSVTKGAGLVFVGLVISKILTYFYRLFVARYYGPDYYGLMSIGISVIVLLTTFILLGLDSGVIRFTAFYNAKNDKRRVKGAIITPFRICLPLAIVVSASLWIFAPSLAGHFSLDAVLAGYLTSIFRILSVSIPFFVTYSLVMCANKGLQKIKYNVYADYIFFSIVQIILVSSLFLVGFDVTGIAISYATTVILSLLFILYFFRKNVLADLNSIKSVVYTKKMIAYSLPLALGNFASIAINYIDTIFLGVFRTASETGIYNAALPTAGFILVFGTAFGTLFFPIITELYSKGRISEMKIFYKTVTNWVFIITLPFALIFMIFSDNILLLLFGQEYVYGASALSVLTLTYLLNAVFTTSALILLVINKTKYNMANVIFASLLVFSGNIILIPIYGMMGAAITAAISAIFLGSVVTLEVWHFMKTSPFSTRIIIKSISAGLASVAFVFLLYKNLHLQSSLLLMAILFLLFISLYFFLLLLLRSFNKNDLMILSSIEKRIGVKSNFLRNVIKKFIRN